MAAFFAQLAPFLFPSARSLHEFASPPSLALADPGGRIFGSRDEGMDRIAATGLFPS
jgi:hypothetical protein